MAKAWCTTCDTLVECHGTDEPIGYTKFKETGITLPTGSACWQQLCLHVDKRVAPDEDGRRPFCDGSNRKV